MESKRRTTSYDIPRVSSLPRLLRLRADDKLRAMFSFPDGESAGRLEVPSRENLTRGEVIRLEISLGPMADEVVLKGAVASIEPRDGQSPVIVIAVDPKHAARTRYIAAVLADERPATARRYRRVEARLPVRWQQGLFRYNDSTVDLSQGGAFVASAQQPGLETELSLTLGLPDGSDLTMRSAVVWLGKGQGIDGFGVRFVDRDPVTARTLAEVVRNIENDDFR
jgi:Tfp pilus assembly protein PilZ